MTREQQEQLAREQFIEECRKLGGRLSIQQAVEIINKFDLNSRRDKAIYDSDARLAREWIAKDADENGERSWHNIKRVNEKGETVQEFVQEGLFNAEDYRIKAGDERKVLKHSYQKVKRFIEHCYERYGVKLKVDLSFLQPVSVSRRVVKRARKDVQKRQQPRLGDEI